ncbi:MAG: hypothetical protein PHW60_05200 [Kiritimatiellae bacterium]|nr:hypothetical protein [Kiritimatiellia bacterium]
MNGAAHIKRGMPVARAMSGLLMAASISFAGSGQDTAEVRWAKSYTPRVWTYATGTRITAAYDSYKNGNVYLIADGNEKTAIAMPKLSAQDQAWVLAELKKPYGLINDVAFVDWQDQRPLFQINTSFFAKGNLTESPVVEVQYLLLDPQNRAVKRICDPVVLYPTVGKQNFELLGTKVLKPCLGPREQNIAGVKQQACRAVMLLWNANKTEWLVLDAISKQDDIRLRTLGIPSDWWDPRYPAGVLQLPLAGGDKK